MILVDTSVWIHHLREGRLDLESSLIDGEVWCHPFIVGELACGNIRNRGEILGLLQALPMAQFAQEREVLSFIESYRLYGSGVGLIDVHLLASARLSDLSIWTLDKNPKNVATKLGLCYK
jgi:predicted nucleic acid-binding protein